MKQRNQSGESTIGNGIIIIFSVLYLSLLLFGRLNLDLSFTRLEDIKASVEKRITNKLPFETFFINADGFLSRALDRNITDGSGRTVVRDSKGYLHTLDTKAEGLEGKARKINCLGKYSMMKGAEFLYVQAPFKADTNKELLPAYVEDFSRENTDSFLEYLNHMGTEILDLREYITPEDFYKTDHHWKIETAFMAADKTIDFFLEKGNIKEKSNLKEKMKSINYPQSFVGSLGRRTGEGYSGRDDFVYLFPEYETKYKFKHIVGEEIVLEKEGEFKEALISNPADSDYYCSYLNNTYCEMVIKNELAPCDQRVLIIADSFGRPYSAFLSLYFQSIVSVDPQEGRFQKDIYQYIDEYKPDIVLMLIFGGEFNADKVFELGVIPEAVGVSRSEWEGAYVELLNQLINTADEGSIYQSLESLCSTHQEAAKVLESELIRYKKQPNEDSLKIIRACVSYLIDHKDDNCDGEPGWGMKESWDAFSDGSINPEDHVYATQISDVCSALLQVVGKDIVSPEMEKEIIDILCDITIIWNTKYWTEDKWGAYYWYSTSECDKINVTNTSAQLAGTFSKVIVRLAAYFDEDILNMVRSRIDQAILTIIKNVEISSEGFPIWQYIYHGQASSYNDIVHHAFIVNGLLGYMDSFGDGKISWTRESLIRPLVMIGENQEPASSLYRMFDCEAISYLSDHRAKQLMILTWMVDKYNISLKQISSEDIERQGAPLRQQTFFLKGLAEYIYR